MITQERMEAALNYLAESDDDFAVAKADLLRAEIVCKRTRARLYLETTGSVDERKGKCICFLHRLTCRLRHLVAVVWLLVVVWMVTE